MLLPLTFLSGAFMQLSLAPELDRSGGAASTPSTGRSRPRARPLRATPTGAVVLPRLGLLAALLVLSAWLATRAFRAYQRSI